MHDTYSLLREFADSWALLVLFSFFVGAFVWVWRPGSRTLHEAAARSIFRDDEQPAPRPGPDVGDARTPSACHKTERS